MFWPIEVNSNGSWSPLPISVRLIRPVRQVRQVLLVRIAAVLPSMRRGSAAVVRCTAGAVQREEKLRKSA